MQNITYEIIERRQKMHIKSYALLCLILIVSIGFFSYKKWQDYTAIKSGILENDKYIDVLAAKTNEEKNSYEENKPAFSQLSKEVEKNLKTIFPSSDNYTSLTRQFDDFEAKLSKKNSVFEISNIDYQSPTNLENYAILPVRMTIMGSRENFNKFLHLVENSGALTTDVRLMDIVSIRINFENSDSDDVKNQIINFAVQINAYFQKNAGE